MRTKSFAPSKSPTFVTPMQAIIVVIGQMMSPEYKREVVDRAIRMRANVSVYAGGLLNNLLREHSGRLRVPGYRDASKVPVHSLHLVIEPIARNLGPGKMMEAVLRVWEETQDALRLELQSYLQEKDIPVRSGVLSNEITGEWTLEELTTLAREFVNVHPAHNENDAVLMVCCLSGKVPLPDPDGTEGLLLQKTEVVEIAVAEESAEPPSFYTDEETGEMLPENTAQDVPEFAALHRGSQDKFEDDKRQEALGGDWSDLLAGWRHLPPESPQWEQIDDFVAALRALAEVKQEQKNAGRRALRQAIDTLEEADAQYLAMFKVTAAAWTELACPLPQCAEAALEVAALNAVLRRYIENEQAGASNPLEGRRLRPEQQSLDGEIEVGVNSLNRLLTFGEPPEPSAAPPLDSLPSPDTTDASAFDNAIGTAPPVSEPAHSLSSALPPQTEEATASSDAQNEYVPAENESVYGEEADAADAAEQPLPAQADAAEQPLPTQAEAQKQAFQRPEPTPADTSAVFSAAPSSPGDILERAREIPYPPPSRDSVTTDLPLRQATAGSSPDLQAETAAMQEGSWAASPQVKLWEEDTQLSFTDATAAAPESDLPTAEPLSGAVQNTRLLWDLIEADDLPGAYWLARCLEDAKLPCALPASTLAACQNARWLSFSTFLLLADSRDAAPDYVPEGDEAHILMGFAAAALPALLSPGSSFVGWLNASVSYSGVKEVVDAVREFARFNRPLRPEDLAGAQAPLQREAALRHAANEAAVWMQEAHKKHPPIRRARDIWERLLRRELEVLLAPVSADRRAEAAQVRERQKQYQRRDQVQQLLMTLGRELHRRKEMDLQGDVRETMIRDVMEAAAIADRWCALTERREQEQENWFTEHISQLRTRLQDALPLALAELKVCSQTAQREIAIASQCLRRSLLHLAQALQSLPLHVESESVNEGQDAEAIPAGWWLHDEREREKTLLEALSRRLLWFPEVRIETGSGIQSLESSEAVRLQNLLTQRPATALHLLAATEGWLEKRDFRFIDLIRRALQNRADAPALKEQCDEALAKARGALRQAKEQAALKVDRALIDGVIAEDENDEGAASYAVSMARVEAVQPEDIKDFEPEFARLREVEQTIADAEHLKAAALKSLWEELRPALALLVAETQYKAVCADVDKAFDARDTRLVDEYLAKIREARDTGREFDLGGQAIADEQTAAASRMALEEFLKAEARITEALHESGRGVKDVEQALRNREAWAGLPFSQISPARLEEGARVMAQWQRLKQKRGYEMDEPDSLDAVTAVLNYLGFTPPNKLSRPSLKNHSGEWAHIDAQLVTNNLARPIAGYGALVDRYDIVLLWNRPGMEAVSARLETMRLTGDGVIVLYMDRLKRTHRDKMAQIARGKGFGFAMLDETLLVFLAAQRDARLPALLRCTLPFVAPMPYTPDRAGAVPPEMFFGRDDMARDLQDMNGSCLVYGGRQLGKSALLAHAQRQFHQPENDNYAWVESISAIGNEPMAHMKPETLYELLRDKFVEHGLIKGPLATKPDTICRQIREAVTSQKPGQKSRRVVVMLDEADNFLEADAETNFRIVAKLRDLMQETNRHFKVVFAGLHHVQKFQSIPNQPLAHFGKPHLVGPLPFREARRLVREPLEALGFRIEEQEVVRILSHTNYHPGLIQNYCQELLKGLYKGGRRDMPTPISKADVERIYREPEVRRFISGRFELTLDLDTRYRAIAYAIIVEQIKVRDSYALSYPDSHVHDMVRGWCPQLFKDTNSDDMRALLEEMCGLGVLVRCDHGYRLRSPNLVRLMGTETDIEHRLLDLGERKAYRTDDPESLHPPLDNTQRRYSPLTYTQESALNPRRAGVGVLFASEALGWDYLPQAVRRFVPEELLKGDSPRASIAEMPARYTGVEEVAGWLRQQTEKARASERVVIYQTVPGGTPGIEKRVRAALNACEEVAGAKKGPHPLLNIFFLMSSGAAWQWVSQSPEALAALEVQVFATWPRLWNTFGIKQRLRHKEMNDTDETCQAIQQATGGWPWLLERFFEQCGPKNPRQCAEQMQQELAAPASELAQEFRRRLGLPPESPADRLLKFIKEYQDGEQGMKRSDLLSLAPEIIQEKGEAEKGDIEQKVQALSEACIEYLCRLGCLVRQEHAGQGLTYKAEPFLARLL